MNSYSKEVQAIVKNETMRNRFREKSYAIGYISGQKHPTNWLCVVGNDGWYWVLPRAMGQVLIDNGFEHVTA